MDINEKKGLLTGAISLLADVCDAAGSPTGKQTPEELVARIRRMREALEAIVEHKDPSTKYGLAARIASEALDPPK